MAGGIRHDYQSSIYFSLHGSIHDAKQSINLYGQVEQAIFFFIKIFTLVNCITHCGILVKIDKYFGIGSPYHQLHWSEQF